MEMFGSLNFTILGFPCNQFGLQSPGRDKHLFFHHHIIFKQGTYYNSKFTRIFSEVNEEMLNILKYVRPGGGFVPKFPMFSKVEVNGLTEEPLFTYLKV